MADIAVTDSIVIPAAELEWRFGPSGGPGGQHANRSATRAELVFDLEASTAFPDEVKHRIRRRLGDRVRRGTITVSADDTRSQYRNRELAAERLATLLRGALHEPKRRKRTRPTRAARARRLESKKRRSEKKRLRRRPELD